MLNNISQSIDQTVSMVLRSYDQNKDGQISLKPKSEVISIQPDYPYDRYSRITPAEGPKELLKFFDRNNDDQLSIDELQAFIRSFDKNRNGKIDGVSSCWGPTTGEYGEMGKALSKFTYVEQGFQPRPTYPSIPSTPVDLRDIPIYQGPCFPTNPTNNGGLIGPCFPPRTDILKPLFDKGFSSDLGNLGDWIKMQSKT